MSRQSDIVLTTLNAKYVHANLGLRYLYANMQELQPNTSLHEFSINGQISEIAEQILAKQAKIVGLGVYIWNVSQSLELICLLKTINPKLIIVLGGPEVSYEASEQALVEKADYVIQGQGDLVFYRLCKRLLDKHSNSLNGSSKERLLNDIAEQKLIKDVGPNLSDIRFPYAAYTSEDIAHRLIYVEASRGCPFKCEFCLSALDKTSYPFHLEAFLDEIDKLYQRGARRFKFVDRTFNLKIADSQAILDFFLARLSPDLFLHFEIIPDRLPEALKQQIAQFPKGSLQFEIGIQTFNPKVQTLISRKQDNQATAENLRWLATHSQAHLHTDLILGLPGEDLNSFAEGFDKLVSLKPHDIQLGILKRLRGTPLIRHEKSHQLRFNPNPPYDILSTDCLSYEEIREMSRFARYWEIIANSGLFPNTLALLLGNSPFQHFRAFSKWLYESSGQTHKFSSRRLFDLLFYGAQEQGLARKLLWENLWQDYQLAGLKGRPEFMKKTEG